ncbi:MAG: ribosomal L7Ae/L30e/S12e/Gadd45 family protein [Clostridia bacterium]|nr:ribosomal L7Ae/L30e/S12e/Gadd45 family protein [Clostridia bacterium]
MKETEKKALAYLGFAVRAGRVAIGVPLVCEALKKSRDGAKNAPMIVLEAADTSNNTHKRVEDRTAHYRVPAVRLLIDSAALATAVGKRGGAVGAVAVTDQNLAKAIAVLYGISFTD